MGRPPKAIANPVEPLPSEPERPKEEKTVPNLQQSNKCPWCNGGHVVNELGDINQDQPRKNTVLRVRNGWQCLTCSKHWKESALGQKWTLDLERGGEHYAQEMKRRSIHETAGF